MGCIGKWKRESQKVRYHAMHKGNFNCKNIKKEQEAYPKVVFRYGVQDKQVKKFLETRKLLLNFLKRR